MGKKHQDKHFEEFAPHTRLKHSVLEKYLIAFLTKLFFNDPTLCRVVLIDGFAGQGSDGAGNSGSPVWFARCAAMARDLILHRLQRAVSIDVFLIEAGRSNFEKLCAHMHPFGEVVTCMSGDSNQRIPEVLRSADTAPVFVFIDPYGIKGLRFDTISSVVTRPHSEVIVLVDDDGADRLVAVVRQPEPKRVTTMRKKLDSYDLFSTASEQETEFEREAAPSRKSLKQTAERSATHLTHATGSDAWRELAKQIEAGESTRTGLVDLLERAVAPLGATYTTRMPVHKIEGEFAYTLLHASRSASGRQTMKEAIQAALNGATASLGYSTSVLDTMRGKMATDLAEVFEGITNEFAGQTVSWTENLKPFILRHTGTFPWQLEQVKSECSRRGWKNPGRKLVYSVPSA